MKFQFSFQKVLDIKEKEKEAAQQEYSTAIVRQLEMEEQIEQLEAAKQEMFNHYNDVDKKTVWEILQVQHDIEHVNTRMKGLEHEFELIHQNAEQKHRILLEKTQETKVWNQWKEKSRTAFEKLVEQKEQAMLDEMAVLRYSRKL